MLTRAATVVHGQGAVDGHDVRQGRPATARGTGQLKLAPITVLSRGILGGDGDRPELAAAHNCCLPLLAFIVGSI